jgi:hypothetical protein
VERLGIPAAGVITHQFSATARAMARLQGLPDYTFVVIPHPLSDNTQAEVRAKAEETVRQAVQLLRSR